MPHRQTDRQTDKQTNRYTDRQTDLAALARGGPIVDAGRLVAAHLVGYHLDLGCNRTKTTAIRTRANMNRYRISKIYMSD